MGSHSAVTTSSAADNGGREISSSSSSSSVKHQLGTGRLSHKISKQPIISIPKQNAVAAAVLIIPSITQPPSADSTAPPTPQQPHQPPVYNVSKDDFRELVQRLTGAPPLPSPPQPPQDQASPPPPATSSRLHRIRPPPLMRFPVGPAIPFSENTNPMARSSHPISPLPPLPGVHGAVESPVSAYMRRLRSSSTSNQPSCLSPLSPPPVGPLHMSQLPLSPLQHRLIPQVPLFPQLPVSPTAASPRH